MCPTTDFDSVKDRWVEEVDTSIDPISDEFNWFLDESVNDCRVGFGDDDTVVGWFGDFGYLDVSARLGTTSGDIP
jgi:hypothetical protein